VIQNYFDDFACHTTASTDAYGADAENERFQPDPTVCRVRVSDLYDADSPRIDGEDAEHIKLLASLNTQLPPILVHRSSMRIIDGMHRLGAAKLRGEKHVRVRFFDGSESDAFVLAVKLNVTHGRPLGLKDRNAAAERIIASHPQWADRAIAAATGLGTRVVAQARRHAETTGAGEPTKIRIGRDGRARPTDYAEGRLRASAIITNDPHASLRRVAREAGVSLSTAQDVRNRLSRGEDPVPAPRGAARRTTTRRAHSTAEPAERADLDAMMQGLANDPSLRFSESGRKLLRWMLTRVARPTEFDRVSDEVPAHSAYIMARIARQCATEWLQIADDLQRSTYET
jgi:hypothetical protein